MSQLDLFAEPPRPAPKPVDLPTVNIRKNCGRTEVCYRNPDQPAQAWTGRGKPPRWVTEWVQGGKSLESLRVPEAR